jgi:hypothetical protein
MNKEQGSDRLRRLVATVASRDKAVFKPCMQDWIGGDGPLLNVNHDPLARAAESLAQEIIQAVGRRKDEG